MTMIRTLVPAQVKSLGDDEVEVRMSTATVARDGHILIPQGARLENYKLNPVFLWNHNVDAPPVGRAEWVKIDGNQIVARVRFAPAGISQRADEIRGLTKTGFINGVSVGFDPIDGEPIDPRNPRAGMRFSDWELIECSFCCVPVDTTATVTARATAQSNNRKPNSRRNMDSITTAQIAATTALDEHRAAGRHHAAMSDSLERLDEHRKHAGTALRAFKQALEAADPTQAAECAARCRRSVDGMARELRAIGDRHGDATDAHTALTRALRDAESAMSSLAVQKSDGIADDHGSRSADFRRRQRDLEALSSASAGNHDYQRRQRDLEYLELAAKD